MDPPDEKTRLLCGEHGRCGVVARRSVGSAALEGVEEHFPHGSDVRLDPVEAVAIHLAIFAALLVGAVAFGDEFAIKTIQQGLVGEGLARDRRDQGHGATDQGGQRGGDPVVPKGPRDLPGKSGLVVHHGPFRPRGVALQ